MNVLAIESAVAEGSIAIIRGDGRALSHVGNGASRAERILPIILDLLKRSDLAKQDLDLIAVSTGPGSYSGIRIGMSTALGLRDALSVRCIGIPVLAAMSSAARADTSLICAVPVGKRDVAWQSFGPPASEKPAAVSEPRLGSLATFAVELEADRSRVLFASGDLLARVRSNVAEVTSTEAKTPLAEYVGRFAEVDERVGDDSMHPIYLRNHDVVTRSF